MGGEAAHGWVGSGIGLDILLAAAASWVAPAGRLDTNASIHAACLVGQAVGGVSTRVANLLVAWHVQLGVLGKQECAALHGEQKQVGQMGTRLSSAQTELTHTDTACKALAASL